MNSRSLNGKERPLTPVQQGMVFHHLSGQRARGVDVEQVVCELDEQVDAQLLEQSWQRVVAHVGELRTYVDLTSMSPEQRIADVAAVNFRRADWSAVEVELREPRFAELLDEERTKGLDITAAPLYRLVLVTLDRQRHRLLWTFHHLLLDGRSFPLILSDVFDCYDALREGRSVDLPVRPDRARFLEWLEDRDHRAALEYWRAELGGVDELASLSVARQSSDGVARRAECDLSLSSEVTERLRAWVNARGLTLNSLVQAAWAALHGRYSGNRQVVLGETRSGRPSAVEGVHEMVGVFITTIPVKIELEGSAEAIVRSVRDSHVRSRPHRHAPLAEIQAASGLTGGLFESLVVYDREDLDGAVHRLRPAWIHRRFWFTERTPYPFTLYAFEQRTLRLKLAFDLDRMTDRQARAALRHLVNLMHGIVAEPEREIWQIPLLDDDDSARLLGAWNATDTVVRDACIHELFEQQAKESPSRPAVISGDCEITYLDLNARADALARELRARSAVVGDVVGISLDRSIDMVAAVLAVLKTGAAYLPLDPDYPAQRTLHCLEDSGAKLLITQADLATRFRGCRTELVLVDQLEQRENADRVGDVGRAPGPGDLAYLIYTSGSTGQPKGVMVEHGNVVNFFAAMDRVIEPRHAGVWLAVTSLSFDISVLELLWTLTRGFTVVLAGGRQRADRASRGRTAFSLFYFASDEGASGRDTYRLVLEGARFADLNGFEAVWTPERHFHAFGGLYPNPAVLGAAVAATTKRLHVRAGSVVLPLHHPARVAEEWAVVDNLCDGRAGIAFASGWQPNDFVLAPHRYDDRRATLERDVETVRRLWRGEAIELENPKGDRVAIKTLPRPVQAELPVWITAAGSAETFELAGRLGANVLTHLLGQTVAEIGEKVETYRKARRDAGHGADSGRVTLMLHTFVGEDNDAVREIVRQPMKSYLRSAASLVRQYADAWTAYKQGGAGNARTDPKAFEELPEQEMESLLDFAFERYFETSSLFGNADKCAALVAAAREAGVDEIACLIDFGVDHDEVLAHLEHLNALKTLVERRGELRPVQLSELIEAHGVTHLQCTPGAARALLDEEGSAEALGRLTHMLIGGEAFPVDLWDKLRRRVGGRVTNMYGPTETTVWSTTHELTDAETGTVVPIGRPIANTQCYVLDEYGGLVPVGIAGELYIGGRGVARGYWGAEQLTKERFIAAPPAVRARGGAGSTLYRTGDIARWREDGRLEFLGRGDNQVKIRGFRVELGDVEAHLAQSEAIEQALVVARRGADDIHDLVAYCIPKLGAPLETAVLQAHLRRGLPDYMIPTHFVEMRDFPRTPNGKIDRKALPDPTAVYDAHVGSRAYREPVNETEQLVKRIWESVLGLSNVGTRDNFFDIGGHSLRAVQVQGELRRALGRNIPITDLFRFSTVETFAAHLQGPQEARASSAEARGQQRRRALNRRSRTELS